MKRIIELLLIASFVFSAIGVVMYIKNGENPVNVAGSAFSCGVSLVTIIFGRLLDKNFALLEKYHNLSSIAIMSCTEMMADKIQYRKKSR